MRIMFVIFSFNVGGIERLLIDMCNTLERKGYNVWLCIINKDYSDSLLQNIDSSVNILHLNRPAGCSHFQDIYYMRKIAFYIRHYQIEVLHCHGINCVLFSALCKLHMNAPVIINTVHDSRDYPSYSAAKILLSNLFLTKTIAISDSVKKEILKRFMSPRKVITIYNAINTSHFHYISRDFPAGSTPLRSHSKIELINVARFFPEKKGQDLLVYAVEKLVPKYPSLHVTFAGDIFKGQEESFDQLNEYIKSHKLSKHICFAGNVDNIPALLASGDIFVLPSRYEGFGIALIEALATGMPSVASNLEGPAEIMEHEGLGILFKTCNIDDLADTIDKLIQNYECFDRKAISNYITSTFQIGTMVDKHIDLYRMLCHKEVYISQ